MTGHRLLILLTILTAFALRIIALDTLPLSLSQDEATNGLDAWRLIADGHLTPLLQTNFGRESLFFYLQGGAFQIYGVSFFTVRIIAAWAGILTVPILYVLARRLFQQPQIALLAIIFLSTNYWHIYFSRLGLRGTLLLPILLLAIYFVLRISYCVSRSSHRRHDVTHNTKYAIIAGGLFGLTLYSYLAARLWPALWAVLLMLSLWRTRLRWRILAHFTMMTGVAGLVALPLLAYYQTNPQTMTSRTQAISVLATDDPLMTIVDNGLNVLQLHVLGGMWLENWPALHLFAALGFGIGLWVVVSRCRQNGNYLFLLAWWVVGIIPLLMSIQNWSGETTILRGIIVWPATCLIAAIGVERVCQPLRAFKILRGPANASFALSTLLITTTITSYNYFQVWATTIHDFSEHPRLIAHHLNQQTEPILIPRAAFLENATQLLLKPRYPEIAISEPHSISDDLLLPHRTERVEQAIQLDPANGTAYLLTLHPPTAWTPVTTLLDYEAESVATHVQLTEPPTIIPPPTLRPISAPFSDGISLTGYQVAPSHPVPGETVTLHLNWLARHTIDGDFYLFVHLFDVAQRQRWGQVNQPLGGALADANRWPPGLPIPDAHTFTLPADLPDGPYRFELGLYHAASQQRLTLDDGVTDQLTLGKFWLNRTPLPTPQHRFSEVVFADKLALSGLDLALNPNETGEQLDLTLYWQAVDEPDDDYTVFVHVLDGDGQIIAQQDSPPQQGRYPTSWWSAEEIIADARQLSLFVRQQPHKLRIGWYHPHTGQRLLVTATEQEFFDFEP